MAWNPAVHSNATKRRAWPRIEIQTKPCWIGLLTCWRSGNGKSMMPVSTALFARRRSATTRPKDVDFLSKVWIEFPGKIPRWNAPHGVSHLQVVIVPGGTVDHVPPHWLWFTRSSTGASRTTYRNRNRKPCFASRCCPAGRQTGCCPTPLCRRVAEAYPALASLEPGTYELTIKVNDKIANQKISPAARFVVE